MGVEEEGSKTEKEVESRFWGNVQDKRSLQKQGKEAKSVEKIAVEKKADETGGTHYLRSMMGGETSVSLIFFALSRSQNLKVAVSFLFPQPVIIG